MERINHICLMANYNQWMNHQLYHAASKLPTSELTADKNAFFRSILGTLNHIAVADTIWLKRFANHPAQFEVLITLKAASPTSLDQPLFSDIDSLYEYRKTLDNLIINWVASLKEADLDVTLNYQNMKGISANKNFFSLLMHFFNHQTHHRGQASTLLFQSGVDIGVTDLLTVIPNE